jgi:hypothetical protein
VFGRHNAAAARHAISLSRDKEMAKENTVRGKPLTTRVASQRICSRLRWLRFRFAKAALKGFIQLNFACSR